MENRIEISATAAIIHRNPTFAITRNSSKVAVDLLTISKLVLLGGEGSEELGLLLRGLEAAMTELGGGVDELERSQARHCWSSVSSNLRRFAIPVMPSVRPIERN